MGIGDRLKRLQAAAEERGPLEPLDGEDDNEFKITPHVLPDLPPLDPSDVFSDDPAERARVANYNAGLDCETCLIQPSLAVPRLVVTGYQAVDGTQSIVTGVVSDGRGGWTRDPTVHARAFLAFTEKIIRDAMGDGKAVALKIVGTTGLLINQNVSFDLCVIAESAHRADVELGFVGKVESLFEATMQRIFEILDLLLVEDSLLRERLLDLAEGTLGKDFRSLTDEGNPRRKLYNLKVLAQNYLNIQLDKLSWRLGYSRYTDVPLEAYEDGARKYLTDDVESALHVAARQQQRAEAAGLEPAQRIPDSAQQVKYAFSLNLVSAWGMRTDLSKVQQLDADLDSTQRKLLNLLKQHGIVRSTGRDAGTRDMKRIHSLVEQAYKDAGQEVPRTEKGNISTAGGVLEDIAQTQLQRLGGDVEEKVNELGHLDEGKLLEIPLYALSQYVSVGKLVETYLPVLQAGTQHPINTRFQTILETGRVSSARPNLNNMPRGGVRTLLQRLQARVRQCFVPRPGFVLSSVDYSQLELACLSQLMYWYFGDSKMGDAINADFDLHLLFAADQLLHIPYEEALRRKKDKQVSDLRQLAKIGNFSLGGGAGPGTLVKMAATSYGVSLTLTEATELKEKWLNQWQMRPYFRLIQSMLRGYDDKGQAVGALEQFISKRVRSGARYCALANSGFQALGADLALSALYEIIKACYLLNGSMYGARVIGFFYDETLAELPIEKADEYAKEQTRIMVDTQRVYCPDVKPKASPALQECWMKEAEEVHARSVGGKPGKLIPWKPDEKYVKEPETGFMVPMETFGVRT